MMPVAEDGRIGMVVTQGGIGVVMLHECCMSVAWSCCMGLRRVLDIEDTPLTRLKHYLLPMSA